MESCSGTPKTVLFHVQGIYWYSQDAEALSEKDLKMPAWSTDDAGDSPKVRCFISTILLETRETSSEIS